MEPTVFSQPVEESAVTEPVPPTPPTPPVPPTPSPAAPIALSVLTAVPVSRPIKRQVRAFRARSTMIFNVLVALLIAAMVFNGIYAMPDGEFSRQAFFSTIATLCLCGIWKICMVFIDAGTPNPMPLDVLRVNEIYEQGAMSTSVLDRVVIPFDEVTAFVETEHWLGLFGKTGELVWTDTDVTAEEAQQLLYVLASHLPQTVFTRKSRFLPKKPLATPPPASVFVQPSQECLPAKWSAREAVKRGYAAMLKRAAPLFFLMSMVLGNILCDSFGWFADDSFAGRLLLMAVGSLVCAGIGWLLVAWEQTAATKAANKNEVCLHLLSDGVRVQDGAAFTVIPKEALRSRRDQNGNLCVLVDNRVLTVSFAVANGSDGARTLFKV